MSVANRGGPSEYGSHKWLLKNKVIWGAFLSSEVGIGKEQLSFFIAGPSCSCAGYHRGSWQAWSKGRTRGHLKCWSPCPQTLLRKGLIFGPVPFSSFISTEEWFEPCDLFHQHSWLKLNCRVQVKKKLKPFLKAIMMNIAYQEEKHPNSGYASGRETKEVYTNSLDDEGFKDEYTLFSRSLNSSGKPETYRVNPITEHFSTSDLMEWLKIEIIIIDIMYRTQFSCSNSFHIHNLSWLLQHLSFL